MLVEMNERKRASLAQQVHILFMLVWVAMVVILCARQQTRWAGSSPGRFLHGQFGLAHLLGQMVQV